ncbi:hypothetical protein [Clostridium perfringens]|uniref:hypothetical protein n=1 Tax=Clostridium perfringens TaxID=1502 RepID=UPI0024439A02|nr:hypothetical protein [Clostridium perfringens]MDG6893393.1 hypothetical protein [Clostridium perfringens]
MTNNKILQSGYVEGIDDRRYVFTYDGKRLHLVPQDELSIKSYDFFKYDDKFFDNIIATNIKGQRIIFLRCKLNHLSSGYISEPDGYICFSENTSEFHTIVFKGKAINYFYRPNQIIDESKTKYDVNNGGGHIVLNTFDEIIKQHSIEIDGKKADMLLSVTQPQEPIWVQEEYTFGKPESILRLDFKESINIENFINSYRWIYNLLTFLNFRSNIDLGDICLEKYDENGKIVKIADVHIVNKKKSESVDVDNTIGYYFINNKINELLKILNEKNLNLLFIPNSRVESLIRNIDAKKYMLCCTSFESVFNLRFPNAKMEEQEKAKEVKQELMQQIEILREKYKGKDKKKRKELKKYADIIELLDFGLSEKIQYCIDKYQEDLSEYTNNVYIKFEITEEEKKGLVENFVKKRNVLTHSSLDEFDKIHIAAYLIVRAYIYVMILDNAGVEMNLIRQAIDRVLE